jgi:NAD(P)H-hydrate epimerase
LFSGAERIAVDAILGTGLRADKPIEGAAVDGVGALIACQRRGKIIVALDIPSGLDASSGADVTGLRCALTLAFGTLKRGHLVARDACGAIVLLDIGLGVHALASNGARLATPGWFRASLPAIPADAHKGTRKKVAIVGGAAGMAGAAILAARGALRSGAGLVKCIIAPESLLAVQEAEPAAIATTWPADTDALRRDIVEWADALLIGPGLGREGTRALVERLLTEFVGPVVLDADALNAFAGDVATLAPLLGNRAALLTPHPAELARLTGRKVDDVLAERFTLPAEVAAECAAAVLLKGVPTVVASTGGESIVVAEGTPVLATGGAGDVLGGMAVTLIAQGIEALTAGALAAYAHGKAAWLVSPRDVRGYSLDDVLLALPVVWSLPSSPPRPPVFAELPAVGERA